MNTRTISTFLSLLLISLIAIGQSTQERRLSNFDKITSLTSFNVVLQKGNSPAVKIEAKNIDPDKITTDVKDGELEIGMEKGQYKNVEATLYITYTSLEAISLKGSGDIICKNSLAANDLAVNLQGSGDIVLKAIDADEVKASLKGSGDIYLAGTSPTVSLSVKGSGDIQASDLTTTEASIQIQGSGDVEIHASNTLNASIMGSGDVRYKGNPSTTIREMGSGNVRKM